MHKTGTGSDGTCVSFPAEVTRKLRCFHADLMQLMDAHPKKLNRPYCLVWSNKLISHILGLVFT